MKKFAAGKLHSGSKTGPKVTNPHQAKAILLSEARGEGHKIPKPKEGKPMHHEGHKGHKGLGKKLENHMGHPGAIERGKHGRGHEQDGLGTHHAGQTTLSIGKVTHHNVVNDHSHAQKLKHF